MGVEVCVCVCGGGKYDVHVYPHTHPHTHTPVVCSPGLGCMSTQGRQERYELATHMSLSRVEVWPLPLQEKGTRMMRLYLE
jgi:hypothetical protein